MSPVACECVEQLKQFRLLSEALALNAHLVKGDDPILRNEVLVTLISDLLGDQDRTLALEEITIPSAATAVEGEDSGTGGDARIAALAVALSAAQTPPFMTDKRVIVVRDVGALTASEIGPLIEYLDNPLDTTELVLVAGGGAAGKKLETVIKATGTLHEPTATNATDVLALATKNAGLKLTPAAERLVLDHVGSDVGMIQQIVATVAGVVDNNSTADVGDVSPYLTDAGSVPIWGLTNSIEKGDTRAALSTLHRLLTATGPTQARALHPLQALAFLVTHYRRLLRLDDPNIRSADEAAAALGGRTNPNAARFRLRQAQKLGPDGLRRAFEYLANADLDLKGRRAIPEDVVMETLVARLCALETRR